jgi:tetratricopeptide (TPR) repeat protein
MRTRSRAAPLRFSVLGFSVLAFAFAAGGRDKIVAQTTPPAEVTRIVKYDTVHRTQGEPYVGTILTEDVDTAETISLRSRTGTVTYAVPRSEVASISRRRSAEDVYSAWLLWIRSNVKDNAARARAELALALWCWMPHPDLEGERPNEGAVLKHLEKAARADPSFLDVYPHLLQHLMRSVDIQSASLADVNLEVELSLLAEKAGYVCPELGYRLGMLLARRLGLRAQAVPYLERALDPASSNLGQRRECREALAEAYVALGRTQDAVALYDRVLAAAETSPEAAFEAHLARGRLRLRLGGSEGQALARADLLKAKDLQPAYHELLLDLAALDHASGDFASAEKNLKSYLAARPDDVSALVDLAGVEIELGKFQAAEKALLRATASLGAVSPEDGARSGDAAAMLSAAVRARLALGSLHELRGKPDLALAEYRQAMVLAPSEALPRLFCAALLVRSVRIEDARKLVEELLRDQAAHRVVFGAASRLLGHVESLSGHAAEASFRFEYAAGVFPDEPAVIEAAGVSFLRSGKLDRAAYYLAQAEGRGAKRPATLNGMGYFHYQRGDLAEAALHFDRALDVLKKSDASGAAAKAERQYALAAKGKVSDLDRLEVWVDSFDGSSPGTIDGWEEVERWGVEVSRQDGDVVFRGRQQSAPDGETGIRLLRTVPGRDLERVSVTLRLDEGRVMPILRVEREDDSRGTPPALILYRDFDGRLRFGVRSTKNEWQTPEPKTEKGRSTETYFPGTVTWPDGSGFHTIEVRRPESSLRQTRSDTFDLWFDGEVVAQNVTVPGIAGKGYQIGIWARTDALENTYALTVEGFRLYRVAPTRAVGGAVMKETGKKETAKKEAR